MLRKLIYIFFGFFYLNTFVFASEFIVGESYSGTLKNLYNQNYNITLPPGTWDVDRNDVEGMWHNIKLFNYKNDGELYLTIPNQDPGYDIWGGGGLVLCDDRNEIDFTTNILARGVVRTGTETVFCIEDYNYKAGESESILEWIHIHVEVRTAGNPLKWIYYDIYYPLSSLKDNAKTDEKSLKDVGKKLMSSLKENIKGKTGDLSIIDKYFKSTNYISSNSSGSSSDDNNNNLSSFSDKYVCQKATLLDGSGWVKINDYVKEAWSRNLDIYKCRVLTKRQSESINKVEESNDVNRDIKSKLQNLKSLLDDGLISQEQYDEKSSQILNEF